MKSTKYLRTIAVFMAFLIVSLPMVFAEELDLQYSGTGALISGDGFVREYNGFGQLIKVRNESGDLLQVMTYHPTEERVLVKKIYEDGVVNQRITYISDSTVKIKNSSGTFYETYVYQNGVLVAQVTADGEKQAIHPDHLGSTALILDENGLFVEDNYYSPFGEQLSDVGNRFGYEGKEFDDKTQDTDFHFRKYRPEWGRFTQPDTLIPNVYDPQSLNRYSFEKNNPIKSVDPDGHELITLSTALIVFSVGFILGALNEYSKQRQAGTFDAGRIAFKGAQTGVVGVGIAATGAAVAAATGVAALGTAVEALLVFAGVIGEATEIEKNSVKPTAQTELACQDPASSLACMSNDGENDITRDNPTGTQTTSTTAGTPTLTQPASQANSAYGSGSQTTSSRGGVREESISGSGGSGSSRGSSGSSRKIGISRGRVKYNIPSSATYSSGFSRYLGKGK